MRNILCSIFISVISLARLAIADDWQQQVDYAINIQLNDNTHHLAGKAIVGYYNNSPDSLHELYFHLYPNAFRNKQTVYAKEAYIAGDNQLYYSSEKDRGGVDILSVSGKEVRDYKIDETILRVNLTSSLPPNSTTVIEISFDLKIPEIFSRLGHSGDHYELTQWYPKACVYDDKGWHTDAYHYLGEFYSDFGNYDVTITLPAKYVVAATGKLIETQADLSGSTITGSDSEIDKDGIIPGLKALHFSAKDVHDFAIAADKNYEIEAIQTGNLAIQIYVLPKHKKAWKDVGKWAEQAIKLYGEWYGDYPYDELKIVDADDSPGAGMEYPGVVLISGKAVPFTTLHEAEVIHEIAHQWFYGMVANNELDEAWLDEGFATFTEIRYFEAIYGADNNILNLPGWIPFKLQITERMAARYYYYLLVSSGCDKSLNTPSYLHSSNEFGYGIYYYKAALILFSLRELMGNSAFDAAMRHYCYRFKFKHPTTDDFIDVCNQFSGQDLSWFFRQWIETKSNVDFEIKRVSNSRLRELQPNGEGYQGLVYLRRNAGNETPVEVTVQDEAGDRYSQIWGSSEKDSEVMTFNTKAGLRNVAIDPNDQALDYYRWNNHYPRKIKFEFIYNKPDLDAYQIFFIPYGWVVPPNTYRLGAIFQGRQFFDAGPALGKHQWSLFMAYDFRGKSLMHSLNYRTPLGMLGRFTRIYGGWSRNIETQNAIGGLSFNHYDSPFSKGASHTLDLSVASTHYSSAYESDPRDVSVGNLLSLNCIYDYKGGGIKFGGGWEIKAKLGKDVGNDVFEFGKISAEFFEYLRFTSKLKLFARLYLGYVRGAVPAQEHFFLSGKLFPDKALRMTWANTGDLSSQQRWHIWGDGNLRGYFGRHLKGKAIATGTIEHNLPLSPIYLFYDTGYTANNFNSAHLNNLKADFGIGVLFLKLLRVDFPFWISEPLPKEPNWDFRIIVGLARGLQ